jgi:hypothetical protein
VKSHDPLSMRSGTQIGRDYTPVCRRQRQPQILSNYLAHLKQETCQKTKAATDFADFTNCNPGVLSRLDYCCPRNDATFGCPNFREEDSV